MSFIFHINSRVGTNIEQEFVYLDASESPKALAGTNALVRIWPQVAGAHIAQATWALDNTGVINLDRAELRAVAAGTYRYTLDITGVSDTAAICGGAFIRYAAGTAEETPGGARVVIADGAPARIIEARSVVVIGGGGPHASTHAVGGTDPLTPAAIGAATAVALAAEIASSMAADTTLQAQITALPSLAAHIAAPNPHPQYAQTAALGNASTRNVGTVAGTVAAGDDGRFASAGPHASTHAVGGTDPLTPAAIGAATAVALAAEIAAGNTADAALQTQISALPSLPVHVAAPNPHPQYAQTAALGNAATRNVGTVAGTVAAGDDGRFVSAADFVPFAGGTRYTAPILNPLNTVDILTEILDADNNAARIFSLSYKTVSGAPLKQMQWRNFNGWSYQEFSGHAMVFARGFPGNVFGNPLLSISTLWGSALSTNGTGIIANRIGFGGSGIFDFRESIFAYPFGSDTGFGTTYWRAAAIRTVAIRSIIGNTLLLVNESAAAVRVSGNTSYTVAQLTALASPVVGDRAFVSDALAPAFLAIVAGGGAVVAPAFFNGTNWVVG